jgi:hypothetical protein
LKKDATSRMNTSTTMRKIIPTTSRKILGGLATASIGVIGSNVFLPFH